MVAVGMLLAWLGYAAGLEGWCLFRDYDVTLGQLMSPLHPYAGAWPPAPIPSSQIWPGKPGPQNTGGTGGQGSALPAVQGSIASEAQQAGSLLPAAVRQAFGIPFTG